MVHNKQRAACDLPDGGLISVNQPEAQRPPCSCDGGLVGRLNCGYGGVTTCEACGSVTDAGP